MYEKSQVKLWRPKSDELSYTYFIEHIIGVTKKSQTKYKKNEENLSLWSDKSRTQPTYTYKHSHSDRPYKHFLKHTANTSKAAEKH
jgi:hypothetical protein